MKWKNWWVARKRRLQLSKWSRLHCWLRWQMILQGGNQNEIFESKAKSLQVPKRSLKHKVAILEEKKVQLVNKSENLKIKQNAFWGQGMSVIGYFPPYRGQESLYHRKFCGGLDIELFNELNQKAARYDREEIRSMMECFAIIWTLTSLSPTCIFPLCPSIFVFKRT